MKGKKNIIIATSAIVVFAAIVGFFITLDVSPQIAYARLFIDAGLVIGLVAVVMAFYREKEFSCDGIVQCVRSLKNGQYKARLNAADYGPVGDVALAINELAVELEKERARQEDIKRDLREELLPGLKQKDVISFEHSLHPELGPVNALPVTLFDKPKEPVAYSFRDVVPVPLAKKMPPANETLLNNTFIASDPPKTDEIKKVPDNLGFAHQEQDLGELYERFVIAQKACNLDQIEYPLFLKTIEKTKQDLMSSYQCQGIFFDIVKEANQVALQPKIVR